MAHFGELLAELRQDHGLTQDQLAEIISASPGTISNYEHGRHLPDLDKLKMIADYFHVTTDYLLGRTSSSIPIDLLQKRLADGKTVSDLISIFLRLSPDRQHALLLILSDMDLLHSVINQCGRRDQ